MTKSKYGRIIALSTTVCVILLGIMFIICTAHLFFTGGENPYSRERVGDYLIILAVPSFLTLGLAIGGVIYNAVTGERDENGTARTSGELLESFTQRCDLADFDEETKAKALAERKKRLTAKIECYGISAVLLIIALIYVSFVAEFTIENLNGDVIAALTVALPLSVIAVGIHIPRIYLSEKSCQRELELLKESIKTNGAPAVRAKEEVAKTGYSLIVRYAVLGVAVILVILGIFNGGMADVFAKAVKICTECIGLG